MIRSPGKNVKRSGPKVSTMQLVFPNRLVWFLHQAGTARSSVLKMTGQGDA
jgi:hypothetical protein